MPCNHDRTLIGHGLCIACYDRAYAHAMCLLLLREAHACTSFSNNDAVIVSILPLAAVKMRCALELCAWFVKTAFQHLGPCCTNGLYLRVMGSSMPCRWSQTDQDSLHIMPSNRRCFLGAQTQQVRLAVLRADTHERKLFREKTDAIFWIRMVENPYTELPKPGWWCFVHLWIESDRCAHTVHLYTCTLRPCLNSSPPSTSPMNLTILIH